MNVTISLLLAFLLYSLLNSSPVLAMDCLNPQTQTDMNQCAAIKLDEATKRINLSYNKFRAKLTPTQQEKLKEVQRAWIKFKDLACQFETSHVAGGSAYSMALANCLFEKTQQRNKELEILGICQEGDLNCPAW